MNLANLFCLSDSKIDMEAFAGSHKAPRFDLKGGLLLTESQYGSLNFGKAGAWKGVERE